MKLLGWILVISVLTTPLLIAVGFYRWFCSRNVLPTWRSVVGIAGSALALTSWGLFLLGVFRGWIGGFGSHYVTSLGVSNAGLLLSAVAVFCALFLSKLGRILGIMSSMIMVFLWGGSQLVA
jgi:hypothetical protein